MKSISHILNTTGISQDMLAAYTGLSRQNLMKAGAGFIQLDSATVIKLSRLQHTIETAGISDKQETVSTPACEHDTEAEMTCRYYALVLQRKLDLFEATQKKYNRLLRALELFEPADEQEAHWVKKTKTFIIKKLGTCGVATCMRLRKRVYLLEAEADYIRKFESLAMQRS